MNKKISTKVGLITGLSILLFILVLSRFSITENSPLIFLQFFILLIGILISCFLLFKYYTAIKFVDCFLHGIKTSITTLLIVIAGNTALFFLLSKSKPITDVTFIIMKTIFAYSAAGILVSFISSLLFNIFATKK